MIRPPRAAPATTWLFVITWPAVSSTKPEPMEPAELPPRRITTVLGSTALATATVFIRSGAGGTGALLGGGAAALDGAPDGAGEGAAVAGTGAALVR